MGFYVALLFDIENSIKCPPSFPDLCSYLLFKVTISLHFQWSSSHEERTKIIQEGLLNPSADILEAMTETEAMHTGKILLLLLRSLTPQLEPFLI